MVTLTLQAWTRFGLLLFVLLACTANVTNSFFLKWGFRDGGGTETFSLEGMIAGKAPKPFVYRSTIPHLVDRGLASLSEETLAAAFGKINQSNSLKQHYFPAIPEASWTPRLAVAYHVMYFLVAISFLAALCYLRKIVLVYWPDEFSGSILSILLFSLLYPSLFHAGGYYYDFFELLGTTASTFYCLRQRPMTATMILALTAWNKETAFLMSFGYWFLHADTTPRRVKYMYLIAQASSCLIIRHFIVSRFEANSGATVTLGLLSNVAHWLNPVSYMKFDNVYAVGIHTPRIQNVLIVLGLFTWVRAGWQDAPDEIKKFALGILVPTALLFMLFGFEDELRNLSLCLPALFIIMAHGLGPFREFLDRSHYIRRPPMNTDEHRCG